MNREYPKRDLERELQPAELTARLSKDFAALLAKVSDLAKVPKPNGEAHALGAPPPRRNDPVTLPASAVVNEEALYQRFKSRLLDDLKTDPIFLRLLASQPEIVVEIEPREIMLEESSLKGRICILAAAGFFAEARKPADVNRELVKTGTQPNSQRLSDALTGLVNDGFLTRDEGTYRLAPGVKVSTQTLTKGGT